MTRPLRAQAVDDPLVDVIDVVAFARQHPRHDFQVEQFGVWSVAELVEFDVAQQPIVADQRYAAPPAWAQAGRDPRTHRDHVRYTARPPRMDSSELCRLAAWLSRP
jgi:hypothetical protein